MASDKSLPEFEIVISRFGNVGVYRRHPDGKLTFWTYTRSIEGAIQDFRHWPVRIVSQGQGQGYTEYCE